MASNQTNRFQSLVSSVEEFIDRQENENTKKKTKHGVALFHEFLVLKGETRQMEKRKHEFYELTYPTFRPTFSQQSKQAAQQPLSLFSGAVISRGHISVAINNLNQSHTLSVREENPSKTYKRIKPLDSDSD